MLVDAAEEVFLREGFEHASVDGLRYEYGIFRQSLQNGWQQEMPDNWLRSPDPWEVARPNEKVEVSLGCSVELSGGSLRAGLYSGAYAGLGYQP